MKKWINLGISMPLLVVSFALGSALVSPCAQAQSAPTQTIPSQITPSQTIGDSAYLLPPGNSRPAPPLPPSSSVGDYAEQRLLQAQQQAEEQALLRAQQEATTSPSVDPNRGLVMPTLPSSASVQPEKPKRPPSLDEVQQKQKERWNSDVSQTLRQAGGSIKHPPHHGFFFSPTPQDQELLHNWVHALKNEGVSEDKIIFEAQRLSKEDFVRWASRFVWLEQQLHPNIVDVYP